MVDVLETRRRILAFQRLEMQSRDNGYTSFDQMPNNFYYPNQIARYNDVWDIVLQSVDDFKVEHGLNPLDIHIGRDFLAQKSFLSPKPKKVRFVLGMHSDSSSISPKDSDICTINFDYQAASRFSKDILELAEMHPLLVPPQKQEACFLEPEQVLDYLIYPETYFVLGFPRVPLDGIKINSRNIRTLLNWVLTDPRMNLPVSSK